MLDITLPPVAPLPPGEQRPMPTDEELDDLFTEIGRRAAEHPVFGAIRAILDGFSSFMLGNRAIIELLIAKGVLDDESRVHYAEVAQRLNVESNKQLIRDFIGFGARGLMRINGRPLAPDDVSALISVFADDAPDLAAAFSTIAKGVLTPEHIAAFFAKAKASEDPLKTLFEYRVHADPEVEVEKLRSAFSEIKAELAATKSALAEAEKDRSKIAALEKEVRSLRDEVTAFQARQDD